MTNIHFVSIIESVKNDFPVIYSKNYTFEWQRGFINHYKQKKQELSEMLGQPENAIGPHVNHINKCPGIHEISRKGFIVQLPWDITIASSNNGTLISCSTSSPEMSFKFIKNENIDLTYVFNSDYTSALLPKKHYAAHPIIKFILPWHVYSNYKLLIFPIPYQDQSAFDHTFGILDTSITNVLNAHIHWNLPNDIYIIKKGTPLFQIIPLIDFDLTLNIHYCNYDNLQNFSKNLYY